MAVHTQVSDRQLREFLEGYDLGAMQTFKGIAEGVENSNFFLETAQGAFVLTLFEKRVRHDDLPYFIGIMRHLVAVGFPAAEPVADRAGQVLRELAGRPAVICTFLPGLSIDAPDVAACETIGAGLARLHEALADFSLCRDNDLSDGVWPRLFAGLESVAERLHGGLSDTINGDLTDLVANWPRGLPTGTIHSDLFPDNALFVEGELSGVIDFYFGCTDLLAYDIAVCLNSWCFSGDGRVFDVAKAAALFRGYRRVRSLEAEEIRALPILARGAAMRYFLTRLIDYRLGVAGSALVTIRDPLDYARRLNFHRQARSPAEYGL